MATGTLGEGREDSERTSLGDDREAMERGQEMERLIGPERVGEAQGAELVFTDLIGGFRWMRPGRKEEQTDGDDSWSRLNFIFVFP